jgi:restriction system protein
MMIVRLVRSIGRVRRCTAMPTDSDSPLMPHGGYEGLRSYAVAKAVYDATVVFCVRFIGKGSRTHDQMVQAARSGVRNISEASGAAATSKKTEMKLTNVARSSLGDELARDYQSFLLQRGLRVWPKHSKPCLAMRERLRHDHCPDLPAASPGKIVLTGLTGLADFVARADPELAGNAMLCAVHQAAYLLRRQLERQSRDFREQGGFTERLHAVRVQARSGPEAPPNCPACGQPMRRRRAGKIATEFWGCSAYPNCRGTREIQP